MTDTMTEVAKVARRCGQCGLYRSHKQFKAPLRATDDPTQPVCDACRDSESEAEAAKARLAKALDLHVIAVTPEGERKTTLGDALGFSDVAKSEQRSLLTNSIDTFGRMAKTTRERWDREDLYALAQRRFDKLVLIGRARRDVAEYERKTLAAKARTAAMQESLAKAQEDQQAQKLKIARLQEAIEACYERAEAGHRVQQQQQERIAAAQAASEERQRDSWALKASEFQSDPILRGVYIARAAGEVDDDE